MLGVEMDISTYPGEGAGAATGAVSQPEEESPILNPIGREANNHVSAPLVHDEMECVSTVHEGLYYRAVTVGDLRRKCGHVGCVPCRDDIAPGVGVIFDASDQVGDLIEIAAGSPAKVAEHLRVVVPDESERIYPGCPPVADGRVEVVDG